MKKYKIEIKWAFIFVAMTLIWVLIEKFSGLHDKYIANHYIYTNLITIPAVTLYIFALLDKKRNYYKGFIKYKQALYSGFIITAIIAILSPLTQYIISILITPEYFNNMINHSIDMGHMTKIEAEKYFNLGNYIVQSLIGSVIMGSITTIIISVFIKTNKSKFR